MTTISKETSGKLQLELREWIVWRSVSNPMDFFIEPAYVESDFGNGVSLLIPNVRKDMIEYHRPKCWGWRVIGTNTTPWYLSESRSDAIQQYREFEEHISNEYSFS